MTGAIRPPCATTEICVGGGGIGSSLSSITNPWVSRPAMLLSWLSSTIACILAVMAMVRFVKDRACSEIFNSVAERSVSFGVR